MYRYFFMFLLACMTLSPSHALAQSPRCDVFFQSITGEICARSVAISAGYFNAHDRFRSSLPIGWFASIDTTDSRRQAGALVGITWSPIPRLEIGIDGSVRNQHTADASIFNTPGFAFVFGSSEQAVRSMLRASISARYEVWKGDFWGGQHILNVSGQIEHVAPYRMPWFFGVREIGADWKTSVGIRSSHTWALGKNASLTVRTLTDVTHSGLYKDDALRSTGRLIAAYSPFGIALGPEFTVTTRLKGQSQQHTYQYAGARLYFSPAKLSGIAQLAPLVLELGAQKLVFEHSDRQMRITSGLGFFMNRPRLASTDFSATLRYRLEY